MAETVNTGAILTSDGNGGYSKLFTETMTDIVKLQNGSSLTEKLAEIDGKLPIVLTSGQLPETLNSGQLLVNGQEFYCGDASNGRCQLARLDQVPPAYTHPTTKVCNYSYTHPSGKQCTWTPDMDGYLKKSDIGVTTYTLSQLSVGAVVNFGHHSINGEPSWSIPWRIIKKNHSGYPSGSVTLIADQIIDLRAFDAKEPNNPDSNRKSYGNNNWRYSNIRQWLNSSGSSWYSATHSYDVPPSTSDSVAGNGTQYQSRPGFLYNFTAAERNLILSTTLTTANNTVTDGGGSYTTTDKVFLPSAMEIGLGQINGISEGSNFGYFTSNDSRMSAVYEKAYSYTLSSNKPSSIGAMWYYWLRSPNASNSSDVQGVGTDGSLSNGSADDGGYGVRPCLNLPGTATVTQFRDWYDVVAG